MKPFRALTAVEQLAAYLREQIIAGSMGENLPGVNRLAKELAVSPKTIIAAVAQLEYEGLLRGQGERRRCQITPPVEKSKAVLRVGILLYEPMDRVMPDKVDLLHRLEQAGHAPFFAEKTLQELGMDVGRVAEFARKSKVDAWVIISGSREILEWFATQPVPIIAQFGRPSGLPIAGMGVRKSPAMREAVRKMIALGHKRIVMIAREERRKPKPALFEQAFLDELEIHGIKTGPYHLPEWEESVAGYHRCLDSLFKHTPPTAMIICEPRMFISAKDYFAQKGIIAPRDISLVCDDPDQAFSWCDPAISHIRWNHEPIVRRVVNWTNQVARGVVDKRQGFALAEFVEGGTIGPAPR
ncbi:MAG: substrate-binding domain-containing protein [Akkermansiaceae bacterium]|jgi:DNA-binding MarR family transcriptional regulator